MAVKTCRDIGEAVDLAYLTVPVSGILDAVSEAIDAGIRNFVIVTSGFAEVGIEGMRLQNELIAMANQHDARILGPNCLGYLNFADKTAAGAIAADLTIPSSVGLVSVSGGIATEIMNFAARLGLGFTHVIATGNEAGTTMGDILDYFVEHPAVKAVAMFAEMIRDPAAFEAAAIKALEHKKPVVILKAGSSPNTAAIAKAHTDAFLGDDRVFSAVCRRLGVIRVSTFEDLAITAHTLANIGPLRHPGVAVVSTSGGGCDVVSDLADSYSVPLPEFAPEVAEELKGIVSSFGQILNPIDLTGAVARDTSMYDRTIRAIARDPQIGLVICHQDIPLNALGETETLSDKMFRLLLDSISNGLRAAKMVPAIMTSFGNSINEHGQRAVQDKGLFAIPGISHGMAALGKAVWWSEKIKQGARPLAEQTTPSGERPVGKREALRFLRQHGIPANTFVPAEDVDTTIKAPEGDSAPPARARGIELYVRFLRDSQWGLALSLGLGGIWENALNDDVVRMLPLTREEVITALGEMSGSPLLQDYGDMPGANMEAVSDVVVTIAEEVLALGPDLTGFEVNPLLVRGDDVKALNAVSLFQSLNEPEIRG